MAGVNAMTKRQWLARCAAAYDAGLAKDGILEALGLFTDAGTRIQHSMATEYRSPSTDTHQREIAENSLREDVKQRILPDSNAAGSYLKTLASDPEGYGAVRLAALLSHPCQQCATDPTAVHTKTGFCPHSEDEQKRSKAGTYVGQWPVLDPATNVIAGHLGVPLMIWEHNITHYLPLSINHQKHRVFAGLGIKGSDSPVPTLCFTPDTARQHAVNLYITARRAEEGSDHSAPVSAPLFTVDEKAPKGEVYKVGFLIGSGEMQQFVTLLHLDASLPTTENRIAIETALGTLFDEYREGEENLPANLAVDAKVLSAEGIALAQKLGEVGRDA